MVNVRLQGGDKRIVKDGEYVKNPETQNRETSYLGGEEGWIPDELQGGDKSTVIDGKVVPKNQQSTENKSSKPSLAYGGTKTWEQAQSEGEESGFDLNQTTRDQRAYEKKMKSQNKNWNKREDNEWKRRQNQINKSVGSSKVYEVTDSDKVIDLKNEGEQKDLNTVEKFENKPTNNVLKNEDGEEVFGASLDATTELNKNQTETDMSIANQRVKEAREEFGRGTDEVKDAKRNRRKTKRTSRVREKTNKRDQKFVDRDEKLQMRIDKRKDSGKDTTRLEKKKQKNLDKQKDWDESGYNKYYNKKMKKYL